MAATEEDSGLSLVPQWLLSPTAHGSAGRSSRSSNRCSLDQHQRGSSASANAGNHREAWPLGSRQLPSSASSRSSLARPIRMSDGSTFTSSGSRMSREERCSAVPSPFSSCAGSSVSWQGNSSTSTSISTGSISCARRADRSASLSSNSSCSSRDTSVTRSFSSAAAASGHLRGTLASGIHSLQCTTRDEQPAASTAAGGKELLLEGRRQPAQTLLSLNDFPSLGAADGAGPLCSPGHHSSPESYTPSMAPYKQGFLASRGSAAWTSRLADVPFTSAAAAAAAAGPINTSSGSAAVSATAGRPDQREVSLEGPRGPQLTATRSGNGTAADVDPADVAGDLGPNNLADALKQSAAAVVANAVPPSRLEMLQRRQSKALVPLLPGHSTKAKTGSSLVNGSSLAAVVAAAPTGLAAAGPGRGSSGRAAATTHGVGSAADVHLSSSGLVQLGKHSLGHDKDKALLALLSPPAGASSAAGAAVVHNLSSGGQSPGAGVMSHPVVLSPTASSDSGSLHCFQGGLTADGSGNSTSSCSTSSSSSSLVVGSNKGTGYAQQRQQLKDRNSFFAVLRKRTASSHSSCSTAELSKSDETEKGCQGSAGVAAACLTEFGGSTAAIAAVFAAASASEDDVLLSDDHLGDQDGSQGLAAATAAAVVACQPGGGLAAAHAACGGSTISCCGSDGAGVIDAAPAVAPADAAGHDLELLVGTPEEEEAFLRSLGWTDDSGDGANWGLTDEEIAAFQAAAATRNAQRQQQQKVQCQQTMVASFPSSNVVLGVKGVRPGADAGGSWHVDGRGLKGCGNRLACSSSSSSRMGSASSAPCSLLLGVVWPAAVASGDIVGLDLYGSGTDDDEDDSDSEE